MQSHWRTGMCEIWEKEEIAELKARNWIQTINNKYPYTLHMVRWWKLFCCWCIISKIDFFPNTKAGHWAVLDWNVAPQKQSFLSGLIWRLYSCTQMVEIAFILKLQPKSKIQIYLNKTQPVGRKLSKIQGELRHNFWAKCCCWPHVTVGQLLVGIVLFILIGVVSSKKQLGGRL